MDFRVFQIAQSGFELTITSYGKNALSHSLAVIVKLVNP